jgi:hypothetical protein
MPDLHSRKRLGLPLVCIRDADELGALARADFGSIQWFAAEFATGRACVVLSLSFRNPMSSERRTPLSDIRSISYKR